MFTFIINRVKRGMSKKVTTGKGVVKKVAKKSVVAKEVTEKHSTTTKDRMKDLIDKQLDGKVYNKHGVKSIDELLGDRNVAYRNFASLEEYEAYLSDLDLIDLHEHASSLLVIPREDRSTLVKNLLREYELKNSEYYGVVQRDTHKFKPLTDEMRRILEE